MVAKIIDKGKRFLLSPQNTVLSAATLIMFMVIASRVLGLVRQRILAHYFLPDELSVFFAAFRLPDLIFEVLVFGTFSSAFIPVFTRALGKGKKEAWDIAGRVLNIGLLFFVPIALIVGLWTRQIYALLLPGFTTAEVIKVAYIARVLLIAQGFFVVSYVLTGVLESLRRFLVPALAPIFYNLGIILGTVFLTPKLGVLAPAIGVVLGAFCHFAIQLPLSLKMGFRFVASFRANKAVKKVGKLALPRMIDVSFEQIQKTVELSLATVISTASYTYYTFANSLQVLPVSLFGTSLAKASLPLLSRQAGKIDLFRKTLLSAIYQVIFLTLPMSALFIVLRIPIVRLVYGTDIFDWRATVQTSIVLSAFAIGIPFQALVTIISRAFYALHDVKTPVTVSLIGMSLVIIGDIVGVTVFNLPVWVLAFSFSIGMFLETIILVFLLHKKIANVYTKSSLKHVLKTLTATVFSGLTMFFFLKFFDRSVWVKRLSFLGQIEATKVIPFEKFVLDTRYTANLIILTALVSLVGMGVYLSINIIFGSKEVWEFIALLKGIFIKHKVVPIPTEGEQVSPTPQDTST